MLSICLAWVRNSLVLLMLITATSLSGLELGQAAKAATLPLQEHLPRPFYQAPPWNNNAPIPINQELLASGDSIRYPIPETEGDFFNDPIDNPFDLGTPEGVVQTIDYDPETNTYVITEIIGGQNYRPPTYMSFDEFWSEKQKRLQESYWQQRADLTAGSLATGSGLTPTLPEFDELFQDWTGLGADADGIKIKPRGSIGMEIGFRRQIRDNPAFTDFQRDPGPQFHFDMTELDIGVDGNIGPKLNTNINYNPRSIFDFQNQIKLEYIGDEDQIIQEVRAGNVNFPLPTTLIPGAQSLFGIQTKLKFGRLTLNNVFSQQRSKARRLTLENGAQIQEFEITADRYDVNRHFFLGQYFRENFEKAVENLPYINSPVFITRLEVYVNDTRATPQDVQRDIIAFADLGENNPYSLDIDPTGGEKLPSNNSNDLYPNLTSNPMARLLDQSSNVIENNFGLKNIVDYRKTSARRLDPSEFSYDPQLGYVSLNFALRPNEELAVSYEYTTIFGETFQVGEFPEDVFTVNEENDPRVLFLKMLKSNTAIPTIPIWDLMMKNVYALGAYQVNAADFELNVYYESPGGGDLRYIPYGKGVIGCPLIQVLQLDRLNSVNEPFPDGVFDFLEAKRNFGDDSQAPTPRIGRGRTGNNNFSVNNIEAPTATAAANAFTFGTINARNGRLVFPVLEPFGNNLRERFETASENDPDNYNQYVYDYLYDSTQFVAAEYPEFNRFYIRGEYKTTLASEISLGAFNVPEGSLRVTAGGQVLLEGSDYEVNYSLGRITILNDAYINAGIPINVTFEDNATFGLQQRTMIGSRADYWINDDFTLGATYMRLSERPFTQKVNYGDDPIANSMFGVDGNFYKEAPWITKLVDKLPGLDTKESSSITITAEGAAFVPGHAKAVNICDDDGTVYIDDFEGSETNYDLKFPYTAWQLASTPRDAPDENGENLFPEADISNNHEYGYNRAKMSWYQIDNVFSRNQGGLPGANNSPYTAQIRETELFPNTQSFTGQVILQTFDMNYDPSQRGPYNFDSDGVSGVSAGIDTDGTLKDPKSRWGGVMRDSPYKDFEQSNVEFIEFWLLDPFLMDPETGLNVSDNGAFEENNGNLYLQLGNVSEDVLKDSRQFYENALRFDASGNYLNSDTTTWAVVPKIRPVTFAFDNNQDIRTQQDVGFDGMNDNLEQTIYIDYLNQVENLVSPSVFSNVINVDPSADNFRFFRDPIFDENNANVLDRYRDFNGPEGNSPVQAGGADFSSGGTTVPEFEDLNKDYALNDAEQYFQYRIPIKQPSEMQVGEGFVEDVIEYQREINGTDVDMRWYYFRVPVKNFTDKVGAGNFRNIESIRMFLTDFDNPVVMRFARMNLVRNSWRRYRPILREEGEYLPDDNSADAFFNLSSVNFEENFAKPPNGYRLPPCITREQIANTTTANLLQNEQSLLLQVGDLPDGEGKGAFKRIDMDMRRFKKLKMFVHAESIAEAYNDLAGCQDIEDGDVAAFIRLGDDFQNNYYEYEVPLKITTPITDDIVQDVDVRRWLWPEENEIELNLQDLVDLKLNRNFEFNSEGVNVPRKDKAFSNFTYIPLPWDTTRFAKITVVGSPDLGKVKQVMLGIKNPKRNALTKDYDDGMSKCGEVWFNELRLTDFNEEAGYAALARIDVKLADWGNIALSGNAHTVGFGTLEQRVHQRFLDNYMEYDLSTNLEFGKFFPDRWNLRLPVYAGVSQSVSTPEYDPYDTDIKLEQLMDSLTFFYGEQIADTANLYKKQVQERTTTKSINITNARKERSAKAGEKGKGGKPRTPKPWDIENWGATYAFTQTEYSDHIIQSDKVRRHKGSLDYSYNAKPKYITPFSKLVKSKSLYLRPIKDFNFNLVPNNLSFRTDIDRKAGILNLRQLGGEEVPIKTTYDKFLTWDRYYGLKYNPAKSINLDFTANKRNIIDENQFTATTFQGLQDTLNAYTTTPGQLLPPGTDPYGFSLYGSPYGYGGRPRGYDQSTNISYNVPIDKFPLLSWTKLRTRYGATYGWTARPKALADTLGNTIDNSQSFQVNAELDFNRLYNSIPALKKYNSTRRTSKSSRSKDKAKPKEGEEEDGKKKKRTTTGGVNPVAKTLIRPLLLVRRLSLTYNERNSTEIPGYMMSPQILGIHNGVQQPAPGWGFTLGKQPNLREFLTNDISQKGWISSSEYLTDQVKQSSSNTFNLKANLEPFKDFKIDVNMNLDYSRNHSEFFKVVGQGDDSYNNLSKIDISNFSISYMSLNTIFDEFDTLGISETFRVFEQNADEASQLLAGLNPFSSGPFVDTLNGGTVLNDYGAGYGPYSQDVLVPAFLAAYAGRNLDDVGANPFALLPLPNWRVTYNGLTKLKPFKKIFANMNISHGYNSTLTINNFRNTLEFEDQYYDANILYDNKGRPIDQWMYYFVPEYIRESSTIDTLSGNFFTFYQIPNVTITEQFAPLIGLDITTQSGITASFDYKIARQLSMSFQNYRLTETRSEEFTIGGGYITEGLSIPFLRWGGEPINLENEIAFNFDFSYRDNISTIIFLNQDISEPATGMKTYRFQPSIDYTVNDQMRISLYYERTRNIPATSASFPITNTEGGIRLNFSL